MKRMLNFTVGPVQTYKEILNIGKEQVPYFRTSEFSNIMFENEKLIKKFINADKESRTVFITGSGTASMEAAIINTLTKKDKALIVNGGSFGHRFVSLCKLHGIPFDEIKLDFGQALTENILNKYNGKEYSTFIVNLHETSSGVLYDIDLISGFCKKNNLFLIVDAISSFLADSIDMKKSNIDVIITGSQKALACPPGISLIVLSKKALERIDKSKTKCMYLDLKDALKNAERGQTPFTPAVSILIQINKRLKMIEENGGAKNEIKRVESLAKYFRKKIKDLPFEIVAESKSNAVTTLHPLNASANDIFMELKDHYNIWVCPNGGDLKDKIFRVGHIGSLTEKDYDELLKALNDMKKRNLL